MAIKANMVAYGVRVKLNDNFEVKCLGDEHLIHEDIILISEGHVYNDTKGEYVMIKGGSWMTSGYAYLDQLDLAYPIPNEIDKTTDKAEHILSCIKTELTKANDGDVIKLIVQENKVELWVGDVYTGRHSFK